MNMNGIDALDYKATGYGTGRTRKTAAKSVTDGTERNFANQMGNAKAAAPKGYTVYMKTDDMLYSGGNGSGLSFYLKYAPDSTEDDPAVVAKGVDENGNEFEQTIHINDINPRNATMVEMRALEAYLGVDKNGGLSSLPMDPSAGNMGLYDRANFMSMFDRQIRDMNTLGERKLAAYYRYSMQEYWKFMEEREKSGAYRNAGMSALLRQPGGPLQQRLQKQSEKADEENPVEQKAENESKSDSEIITQPDGSKTLIITNQIGGMKTVTSIELSKPSPMANETQDLEVKAKTPLAIPQDGSEGSANGN